MLFLTALSIPGFGQVAGACDPAFCEARKQQIGTICHSNGGRGSLVYLPTDATGTNLCYCLCSCLAINTPVATDDKNWKAIGQIKTGEKVLALQRNGKWEQSEVIYSQGTGSVEKPVHYAIFVTLADGTTFISTADHIYLMPDGKLKRADRLAPSDHLTDVNMKPAKIIKVVAGEYRGAVHNIAVGKWDVENPGKEGHLINTNGIISGDYYVQSVLKESPEAGFALPQVGTDEYEAMYKPALRQEKMLGVSTLEDEIKITDVNTFRPYKRVNIPKDAIHFLPEEYEKAAPGLLAPVDNSIPYEVAEYIVYNYRRAYPNIIYHVDWLDNTVNAYAWMEGNKRHVALKGGIIRHQHIGQEGLGLILSHEIGHHYGGAPRYPNNPWASCEGQADYWGAMVGQRNVWWGQYAIEQTEKGAQQVYNLFAYGLQAGNLFELQKSVAIGGLCSHPGAACRLATYRAGVQAAEKPACAGDPPSLTVVGN